MILVRYKPLAFENEIVTDISFLPRAYFLSRIARKHGLGIIGVSSQRPKGTVINNPIVTPAENSNHTPGHALDINLRYNGEVLHSDKMLALGKTPGNPVYDFVQDWLRLGRNRWGGNFSEADSVHFDDGLNLDKPGVYQRKADKTPPTFALWEVGIFAGLALALLIVIMILIIRLVRKK